MTVSQIQALNYISLFLDFIYYYSNSVIYNRLYASNWNRKCLQLGRENNLQLNHQKSHIIIVRRRRRSQAPSQHEGVHCVSSMVVLGVTAKDDLRFTEQNYRQQRPSHGGNEAEIFIIAILGENNFLAILGGRIFWHFRGKEMLVRERLGILVRERLGDIFKKKCTYLGENVKFCVKF